MSTSSRSVIERRIATPSAISSARVVSWRRRRSEAPRSSRYRRDPRSPRSTALRGAALRDPLLSSDPPLALVARRRRCRAERRGTDPRRPGPLSRLLRDFAAGRIPHPGRVDDGLRQRLPLGPHLLGRPPPPPP